MNNIREKLQQKMGDTSKQEQRVQVRVKKRLAKKKWLDFKWVGSVASLAACLLIIFFILPNHKPQKQGAVEIGGVMFDEKTGHEKTISDLLYDEVLASLGVTKEEKLFYTPARYTDYTYVTTHCQTTNCRILALRDNVKTGVIYNLGSGTIKIEALSPDKKMVALVLRTKKQDTLRFMYTNDITDHPEIPGYFPQIKKVKWLSNAKIQLTLNSGKKEIITIPRYYK